MTPEQRLTVEAMARAWGQWQDSPEFPFSDDHCINGSRVVIRALDKFGIKAKPLSVQFMLFNKHAWALYLDGVPVAEWPDYAWSLGCGPGASRGVGGKWDGHLCVEGEGFTLDISARQFTRPGKIVIDSPRIMPPLPKNEWSHMDDELGQVLLIRPWPENNHWRNTGGWKRLHGTEVREIVTRTKRVIGEKGTNDGG